MLCCFVEVYFFSIQSSVIVWINTEKFTSVQAKHFCFGFGAEIAFFN